MVTDEPLNEGPVSKTRPNEVITSELLLLVLPDKAYLTDARVCLQRKAYEQSLAGFTHNHTRKDKLRALVLLLSRDRAAASLSFRCFSLFQKVQTEENYQR